MNKKNKKTSDGLAIVYRKYYEGKPERLESLQQERENAEIARRIYDLRKEAKLTQKELAERIGTTPSVISRLEDADYDGHSLAMLRRIGAALNKRIKVRFIPEESDSSEILDPDIINFFQEEGPDFEKRINNILRDYINSCEKQHS